MVGEQTRNDIWQGLLDAARMVRYYEALSERYRRRHLAHRILLLLAAIGGMASLLEVLPRVIQLAAGLAIIALVALDFAFNLARKTSVLNLVNIECTALANEWKSLWASLERVSDDDARHENDRLERRLVKVTGWAGHAEVGVDDALNEKCERVAYKVMSEEYATG